MEEIGIDIRIPQEASPIPTQQGNQASPTQYTEELSSVVRVSYRGGGAPRDFPTPAKVPPPPPPPQNFESL